ncbi:hypothetical protein ACFLZI_02825 [Nitrospirota bacterium]
MNDHIHTIDEILGITRCVQCDHRLEGEIECPFCSIMNQGTKPTQRIPKWIYITASFMTSPISLIWIVGAKNLRVWEKVLSASGGLLWLAGAAFWT